MKTTPISTKYKPIQNTLIKKVTNLNPGVYNAIKKANVSTVDDLLMFLGAYLALQFGSIRKTTNKYLGVVKDDVKTISKLNAAKPDNKLISKMQNQTYIELNSNLVCAEKELMQEFKAATKPYKNTPTHITNIKTVLQNEFIKNGGVKVTYKNGARVPLDKYFMMATRTARNETQNSAAINNAIKLGTDYVFMSPNTSSCKTCAAMGNRVYCISGKDHSYPSVYDTLFKRGYTCIHPHCRCLLRPYFMNNHSESEINTIKQASNRDFDLDEQTEQQRQQYQKSQAFNHRVWDATKEFNKAKTVLDDELPSQLNTLPKFRTAHAKKTSRYKEVHNTIQAVEKLPDSKPVEITTITSNAYDNLPFEMKSKNVIITKKQFERHIAPGANTHDDIFVKVKDKLPNIINNPDYIFADKKRKNTILVVEKTEKANVVIKVSVVTNKLSNSIITIIPCGEKTLKRMLKSQKPLYKKG